MIFSDPENRGHGKLTKPEREQLGSTLAQQGHNPTQEVTAEAVLDALLTQAAQQHDAQTGSTAQTDAARDFLNNRK